MLSLKVDAHSGIPIYLQIMNTIKDAIQHGLLQQGDTLPTVRLLAIEHRVAPNTVMKAYSELQREGLIESRPGVGTVITASPSMQQDLRMEKALQHYQDAVTRLKALGVHPRVLQDILNQTFQEEA